MSLLIFMEFTFKGEWNLHMMGNLMEQFCGNGGFCYAGIYNGRAVKACARDLVRF